MKRGFVDVFALSCLLLQETATIRSIPNWLPDVPALQPRWEINLHPTPPPLIHHQNPSAPQKWVEGGLCLVDRPHEATW